MQRECWESLATFDIRWCHLVFDIRCRRSERDTWADLKEFGSFQRSFAEAAARVLLESKTNTSGFCIPIMKKHLAQEGRDGS